MSNCKAIVKMLAGILAFSGMLGAGSSRLSLTVPVTPDINDKGSRWEYRVTTTYDAVGNRFFTGAVAGNAGEHTISMHTTADSGATITKTGLTPASIYAVPYAVDMALVSNPAYNARVWEMDYFISGTKKYVAAIMQAPTDVGVGGSFLVVVNTENPSETYVSGAAMSVENSTGTPSKFVKLISAAPYSADADAASGAKRILFAAVADPVTGEFDSSKDTVGLRAFQVPTPNITSNVLVELDINGATAGTGLKLGNTPAMMSVKMRKLTSMAFDIAATGGKTLYLGGYMSDDTLGVCSFFINSSEVVVTNNNAIGGTAFNSIAPALPELSRVHRLKIMDGTVRHLVLNAGSSSKQQNNFYVLSLSTTGTVHGKLAQGAANTVAYLRSQLWVAQGTNGVYSAAARSVIGNAPFALSKDAVISGMAVVGTKVYVSTWNAASGTELWVATASLTSNYVSSWTGWQRSANTDLKKVSAFGTNDTALWAALNRSSVYVNSAVGSVAAVVQPSLGLANIKASASRTRLRKVAVFDSVARKLVLGATSTPDGSSMSAVQNFSIETGSNVEAAEASTGALLNNLPIWDMATIVNNGFTDRYYLVHTAIGSSPSSGGTLIVKVAGATGEITSISSAAGAGVAFFKDANGTPAASRCVKIIAGKDLLGVPVLFCLIPGAGAADATVFNGGNTLGTDAGTDDVIKVLDANLGVIAASKTYRSCLGAQVGNTTGLQAAYFDDTLKALYLGSQKSSGDDPGIVVVTLSGTTFTGALAVPSGQATNNSVKDVWQISSLRTVGTSTSRSILLVAATQTGDAGDTNTAGVYALPVFTTSGASFGKIAQSAYTPVATTTATTWDAANSAHLFKVGGTPPWNIQAALVDLKTIGNDVYATIANPPGVTGQAGVFTCSAISDPVSGNLLAWTPWVPVAGLSSSMQNVVFDEVSGQVIGLDLASGQPAVASWKTSGAASAFDQLATALNNDFASNGGVYNLSSHTMTEGIVFDNNVGTGASANLIVATGNQRVAIGHVQYKTAAGFNTQYNPDAANVYGYKNYTNDPALNAIGNIYCSTVSRGTNGWVLVGGENGIGILRVPGARAGASHSGEGWTGSVPKDLMDTTSTTTALSNMTWYQLPGITGPVYGMTTVYDKTGNAESVVAVGKGGVYAFTLVAAKFADITPADLGLTTLSVLSATSGASERMWCVEPVYRGKGVFAVGTTLGMYLAQYDAAAGSPLARLAEVLDVNSASLGPVASIASTQPIFTASTNPRYTLNCVTANARTDVSKHYRLSLSFAHGTGAIVETAPYLAASIKTLDRMTTQILNDASVNTYVAGVPNRRSSLVSVLSKTVESTTSPVSGGLAASGTSSMSGVATVGADGSKLVAVGGRVYVQST